MKSCCCKHLKVAKMEKDSKFGHERFVDYHKLGKEKFIDGHKSAIQILKW